MTEAKKRANRKAQKKHYHQRKAHHEIKTAINIVRRCYERYGVNVCQILRGLGPRPGDGYHIDHIHPVSLFAADDPAAIRAAWDPANLRWVSAADNRAKHAYYNPARAIQHAARHGVMALATGVGSMINSKRKGNRGECAVRKELELIYGEKEVLSGRQTTKDHDIPDLITDDLCVEVKCGKSIGLMAALKQCERDSKGRKLNIGRYCIVHAKYDRQDPVVLLRADDFFDIIKTRRELQSK